MQRSRRVFWSWQSDLPNKTNRTVIHDALERAIRNVVRDESARIEEASVDRDTQGRTGSPQIAERSSRRSQKPTHLLGT